MAFTENLDQFFDDFAVDAVINTTPSRTVRGIFVEPSETVALYDTQVESYAKFFRCKTSALSGVTGSNTATIGGTVYKIGRIRKKGEGTSYLFLKT